MTSGSRSFISLGNKADLSEIDFIEYFMHDEDTSLIIGYTRMWWTADASSRPQQRRQKVKPIILLKSGGTEAGARAACNPNTGALAGSDVAFDAAFRQTGVMRAQGVQDLSKHRALAFAEERSLQEMACS